MNIIEWDDMHTSHSMIYKVWLKYSIIIHVKYKIYKRVPLHKDAVVGQLVFFFRMFFYIRHDVGVNKSFIWEILLKAIHREASISNTTRKRVYLYRIK